MYTVVYIRQPNCRERVFYRKKYITSHSRSTSSRCIRSKRNGHEDNLSGRRSTKSNKADANIPRRKRRRGRGDSSLPAADPAKYESREADSAPSTGATFRSRTREGAKKRENDRRVLNFKFGVSQSEYNSLRREKTRFALAIQTFLPARFHIRYIR